MINTILVPLDGSPLAERALPHAEAIAAATGARLALIRAVQQQAILGVDTPAERVTAMAEAEAYLTEIADLRIARGFSVDTGVVYGGAAAAILAEAERREADLVAMATHGRGGFGRLRYGSVAEALLRRAETPLVSAKEQLPDFGAAPYRGAWWRDTMTHRLSGRERGAAMPAGVLAQCQCPRCQQGDDHPERAFHQQINLLLSRLDEAQRRWSVALESNRIGHGGDRLLAQISGMDEQTIRRGRAELAASLADCPVGRVRRPGGGRPALEKKVRPS